MTSPWRYRMPCLLLVLALAAGCSPIFSIKVSGDVRAAVVIGFYDIPQQTEPSRFNIVHLAVEKHESDGTWTPVWILDGSQSLRTLTYGQVPTGLHESLAPVALVPEAEYRVYANNRRASGRTAFATALFVSDRSGIVRMAALGK